MQIDGQRRSEEFEDRGRGGGGGGGGGNLFLLIKVVQLLGWKGSLVAAALLGGAYLFAPPELRSSLSGGATPSSDGPRGGSACSLSAENTRACDFSRAVLASTEDVWAKHFAAGDTLGNGASSYRRPKLVVFSDGVTTGGCGDASSSAGPFYCPADSYLYLDPTFYEVMESKLKAPGDFAQAYVIAHEVGHHLQNLWGTSRQKRPGETKNETSVRVELQADCLAGVWGQAAKESLSITEGDLQEALGAAHAIGDDALGHSSSADYTHGTSAQRMRWFKRGFESGSAKNCDTFAVQDYKKL